MPTYDYKCEKCGHLFEIYQSMKDDKLTKCPECKKEALKRLIGSGSGLIFKGSGFYLTDYKNKPTDKTSVSSLSNNSDQKKTDTTNLSTGENSKSDKINSDNKTSETKSSDNKSSDYKSSENKASEKKPAQKNNSKDNPVKSENK